MAFDDFKKSISKIFEERISSPFYGTFLISWCLWNWKIIYLTLFISQDAIKPSTKIAFIVENYSRWDFLLIYPFISTLVLIGVIPWVANQLFRISLYYEKQRRLAKEKYDSSKRLTIEESLQLRTDIFSQGENHQRQLTAKDTELQFLKQNIQDLSGQKASLDQEIKLLRKFRILYAAYGKDDQVANVANNVTALLEQSKSFVVNNTNLNGDPAPGIYKELLIIYSYNNQVQILRAKEHFEIVQKENILFASGTSQSEGHIEEITDHRFSKLFPGNWKLTYTGEIQGIEFLQIRNFTRYFAKETIEGEYHHIFNLENLFINRTGGQIEFTKMGIPPDTREVKNKLQIIEKLRKYQGVEKEGAIKVIYERID